MKPTRSLILRVAVAGGVLGLLAWKVGGQPFTDGLLALTPTALLAGLILGAVATVSCAWRWRVVAGGLGLPLTLQEAALAYYRSTFLNVTVPGGVVGDVHRAVDHGRSAGDVSRGLRAVTWERVAGQGVQVVVTLTAIVLLPSPAQGWAPIALAVVTALALALLALRCWNQGPAGRLVRGAAQDIRAGVLARPALPAVLIASVVVVACHTTTFVIAARAAGAVAGLDRLIPLSLLVLAAMAVPLSFAGWGLREGAAAWAFGAAGLGAATGVTAAVVYGVLVLVASLPGAAVLLAARRRGMTPTRSPHTPEVAHG